MKNRLLLPTLALLGGGCAFALRLVQNFTAFEADTGLVRSGHWAVFALPALLAALAVLSALSARRLPARVETWDFPALFPAEETETLMLLVMGIFLTAAGGGIEAAMGLGVLPGSFLSPRIHLVLGAAEALGAAALFVAVVSCRKGRTPFPGTALLPISVVLVARLVLVYRAASVNPTLSAYYVELLTIAVLALAFFHLASFAFGDARPRRFALWVVLAVALALASVADKGGLALNGMALYGGSAVTLLGFLMACRCPE